MDFNKLMVGHRINRDGHEYEVREVFYAEGTTKCSIVDLKTGQCSRGRPRHISKEEIENNCELVQNVETDPEKTTKEKVIKVARKMAVGNTVEFTDNFSFEDDETETNNTTETLEFSELEDDEINLSTIDIENIEEEIVRD